MGIAEEILVAPTAQHGSLLPFTIVLLLVLFLAYLSMLLGTSALSLVHKKHDPAFSRAVIQLLDFSPLMWFVLGIVAPVCLIFLFGQYYYGGLLPIAHFLERMLLLFIAAQVLLYVYVRFEQTLMGVLGHLLLILSVFFLVSMMTLASVPEQWPLVQSFLPHIFSVQVVTGFGIFSVVTLLLTGTALLFFFFRWPGLKLSVDTPYRNRVLYWGFGLAAFACVNLVVLLLWEYHIAPASSHSRWGFILGVFMVFSLFVIFVMAVRGLQSGTPRFASFSFFLALLVFVVVQLRSHELQATANQEFHYMLAHQAQKNRTQWRAEQEANYTDIKPDLAVGQKVFTERCSACHRWEQKLVGPAYLQVLPKYQGKVEELKAFIRNPSKIDPDYPPMPNQGLGELEVQSIAAYLLQESEKRLKEVGK